MAKVTLRNSNGVEMLPKVSSAQISDKGTTGTTIITRADSGIDGFGIVNTNGFLFTQANGANGITDLFDMATAGHAHTISDVIDLQEALDAKVPLVSTEIPLEYFPAVNIEAMQFMGTVAGGITHDVAIPYINVISGLNTATTEAKLDELKGGFVIVTTAGYFVNGQTTMTIEGNSVNVVFDTLLPYTTADDPQPTNTSGAVYLEVGDRIVYQKWVQDTGYTLTFGIINVNNNIGTTAHHGIVQLSTGGTTSRAALSTAVDAYDTTLTEASFRDVMKDVIGIVHVPGNHTDGFKFYLSHAELLARYSGDIDQINNIAASLSAYGGSAWEMIVQTSNTTAVVLDMTSEGITLTSDPFTFSGDPYSVFTNGSIAGVMKDGTDIVAHTGVKALVPTAATGYGSALTGDLIIDYTG